MFHVGNTMSYNEQIVDQVQSLNDIVEIISSYVSLKRAGRNFKANCPFHQEKTPSFIVNPDKQIFHCFGCGVGGDVFSFLMKYEQMNFPEALKHLADRVHVVLPESKMVPNKEKSQLERFYQIYSCALEFYHAQLKHPERGKIARAYLEKRGFEDKEIQTFQLGFALPEWRSLYEFLSKKGFVDQELILSGLIQRSSQGKIYDLFRNRVMFPILNVQGKPIAFGGRVMGEETPKYLNSPESPIFQKRKEMYALNLAKKAVALSEEIRRILIVEGYLDCIRLHANDFSNSVATLGTSLTSEHVHILKRYADEAIVVFDGDKAGEQASLRGLDIFLEEGMSVKVLCLPKGFDPDDFIKVKGKSAMVELLGQSQDVFDFKLQVLLKKYNKSDSLGLLKITSEFLETFTKIQSPVLVDRYLKKLAVTLGVEEGSLRTELQKLKSKQPIRSSRVESKVTAKEPAKNDPAIEKLLLSLIFHHPPYFRIFKELFPNHLFVGDKTKEIFEHCDHFLGQQKSDVQVSTSQLLNRIQNPILKNFASELLLMEWTSEEERETAFQDLMKNFRHQYRDQRLRSLRNQISQAEEIGDQGAILKYMKAYQKLLTQPDSLFSP